MKGTKRKTDLPTLQSIARLSMLVLCLGNPWVNGADIVFTDTGQTLGETSSTDVALGDLDGDGDLDAFVVNNGGLILSGANKVWLNGGRGSFFDSGQAMGDSGSTGVALGDVDGDGDLDAFVVNEGLTDVNKLWLNAGNGVFTDSGRDLGAAQDSLAVALGDLDGDGDLDAFVANGLGVYTGGPDTVWLNDGAGNFTDSGQRIGTAFTFDVVLGDLDGDGDLDAFLLKQGGNQVWLNDGNGTFADSGQSLGDSMSEGAALGDLDGDGFLDAFVTNAMPAGAAEPQADRIWLNDGNGTFADSGKMLGNTFSQDVALGDIDADGDLDAFVATIFYLDDEWVGSDNRVWANDWRREGVVDSGLTLGNSFSSAVALGDLDGDGDLDAFVANDKANKIWKNETPGASRAGVRSNSWIMYE